MVEMNPSLILFALVVAVVAATLIGRYLIGASQRRRLGSERREGRDRREQEITVPMNRRQFGRREQDSE